MANAVYGRELRIVQLFLVHNLMYISCGKSPSVSSTPSTTRSSMVPGGSFSVGLLLADSASRSADNLTESNQRWTMRRKSPMRTSVILCALKACQNIYNVFLTFFDVLLLCPPLAHRVGFPSGRRPLDAASLRGGPALAELCGVGGAFGLTTTLPQ